MIAITGSSQPISELIAGYPENSVEQQVLKQMSDSAETYRYDTLKQLQFELSLRKEIVNAARDLNQSGLNFTVFHKSKVNPEFWERTSNGGFLLKQGVKPSDAIRDIFKNGRLYGTECATAMVIVYYKALLELLSDDTFNRLFPSIYLMNWHRLDPLLREVGTPQSVADVMLGDRGYFINPEVDPEVSELQGENVIIMPGGLYYGHGIGLTTADRILRMLNANRVDGATQSAYFIEKSAARPNFKKLEQAAQGSAATTSPQSSQSSQPSILNWRPFPQPISR